MIAPLLLSLIACGDAPMDTAEPVLYGTIETPCDKGNLAEVSVEVSMPDYDGMVFDLYYCYEIDDGARGRCDPVPEDRWFVSSGGDNEGSVTVECFNRNRLSNASSEDVVVVDWMAPNPDW